MHIEEVDVGCAETREGACNREVQGFGASTAEIGLYLEGRERAMEVVYFVAITISSLLLREAIHSPNQSSDSPC